MCTVAVGRGGSVHARINRGLHTAAAGESPRHALVGAWHARQLAPRAMQLCSQFLLLVGATSASTEGALPLIEERRAPPQLDVWYGPNGMLPGAVVRPDFWANITAPGTAWPQLASNVKVFKLFLDELYGPPGKPGVGPGVGSTDAQLKQLIALLKGRGIRTGIEVGGARWGAGRCNLTEALAYATIEQQQVGRWLQLGGSIEHLATDHADVWDIRGLSGPSCEPAVPMIERIDVVAQVFASWRTFLGKQTSLGFIESLGFWEIDGPDGTNFTCTDPLHLNKVKGWIPRLDDVTGLLLRAAEKHNPTPGTPLIDHYLIDFSLEGVEYDTRTYGTSPHGLVNYNRVLGAEMIMKKHGLKSGVFLNAFHDKRINCTLFPERCSASAANRTLNYTNMYLQLPNRLSEHAVLEQWQPYPSMTGPETCLYTGMWMASQCAAAITKANSTVHSFSPNGWAAS